MEQHPVPQNISSYQFHLVGDMTLKQFLELGAGVLVGVLFYVSGLPGIIKWPLILISAGFGAALAFVPIEERPLERWIVAFFRGVYSPTQFFWEKKDVKYFSDESTSPETRTQPQNKTNNLKIIGNIPFLNKLEEGENSYLAKIAGIFNPVSQQSVAEEVQTQTQPVQQVVQPQVISNQANAPAMVSASMMPDINGSVLTAHVQGVVPAAPVTAAPEKREVLIPATGPISIEKGARPQMVVQEVASEPIDLHTTSVSQTLVSKSTPNASAATFSLDAAPPSVPTIPNTISGQVMTRDRRIIEGAVLEIMDAAGRPVRALRTNRAGHFLNVTQLTNGKYKIIIEKEGFVFEPIEFEAKGEIIAPIAIYAK